MPQLKSMWACFFLSLACVSVLQAEPGLLFRATFDGTVQAHSLAPDPVEIMGPAPSFAPGKFGQALVVGHKGTLLRYLTEGNLVPQAGSISLWIKPLNWGTDGSFHVFFESGQEKSGRGWLLLYKYYQNNWLLLRYADEEDNVGMAQAVAEWNPGEWHHLVGTWTPEALRLYVDGELKGQAPRPLVAQILGETFTLGDNGWHIPTPEAQTLLDEVRIYSYPLSPEQVRRLAGQTALQIRRDALHDRWHVRVEVPPKEEAQTVHVAIRPAAGGEARKETTAKAVIPWASFTLDVSDLPAGDYVVQADVKNTQGQDIASGQAFIRRLQQERLILNNGLLKIVFDGGSGGILALEAPAYGWTARAPVAPAPLFRIDTVSLPSHARFYQPADIRPLVADESALKEISVKRTSQGQQLVAKYAWPEGPTAIVTGDLPDKAPLLSLQLELSAPRPLRPSQAVRVPSVEFPLINGLRMGEHSEDDFLATGRIQGELWPHPAAHKSKRSLPYPGICCVPWQDIYDSSGGLGLIPLSPARQQLEILTESDGDTLTLGTRFWCLLEPGETFRSPIVELRAHSGAWHQTAERFREWSLQNTPPRPQPKWLATCDGWTGAGAPTYKFKELPEMLKTAQYYGFNYLQLWAQMILGGAYYCYFYPNPDLGTEAELRAAIKQIHQMGGHIGFYSNVITFDGAIDDNPALRETIAKYKLRNLPPIPRFYDEVLKHVFIGPQGFYGRGGAAGHSHSGYPDGYWAMNPGSKWWGDYLAFWISKWHKDYGADIWYLDSFPVHGYGLQPANYSLDLEHPEGLSAGQVRLLQRIRQDFPGPLLYEGVACAGLMPWTNWCLGTELSFGPNRFSRPEIFVFSFSDVYPVFSGTCNTWTGIKQIFPDLAETGRHQDALNYVFLLGERFDILNLHPLRKDDPFGQHVRKLVALRQKIRDVVYQGRMRDALGLSGMPEGVEARLFIWQLRAAQPGRARPAAKSASENLPMADISPGAVVVTIWDRRAERTPWELSLDTSATQWPAGVQKARAFLLDGSEQDVEIQKEGTQWRMSVPAAEVCALRIQ